MKAMICTVCGAAINPEKMMCEYCGTYYEKDKDDNVVKIETYQNPIKVYKSEVNIPQEYVYYCDSKEISKLAIEQLSHNLADAIAENMEVDVRYNPIYECQRVTAKIRIIEPKYLF